jgi:mono/diheme cytochrome c family protein
MKRRWYNFLYIRSPLVKIGLGLLAVVASLGMMFGQGLIEDKRMEAQTANFDGRSIQNGATIFANNCSSCHGPDGKGLPGVAPALHSRYFFEQRLKDLEFSGTLHDYVKLTVTSGRPNIKKSQWAAIMPTWSNRVGGPLRDDQVEDVTKFVLNWAEDAKLQTAETDPWVPFQNAPTTNIYSGTAASGLAATVETTATGETRTPQVLWTTMGCMGCHNIDKAQTDTDKGAIAPNMANLPDRAGTEVPGEDASTYVHTSIINPTAYVVPGYNPVMPAGFGDKMSKEELDGLVKWLLDPNRQK